MAFSHANLVIDTLLALAAAVATPAVASAEVRVIISGGFSGAYEKLLPEFEQSTGIKVTTGSGASQGDGPQTIRAQLTRGVPADVVIMSREGLADLAAKNLVVPGSSRDLATTPLGIAVRSGAAKPDIGSVEAVKQALLSARLVAIPQSTSGLWLAIELFPRLGIADRLKVKATPRGAGAAALVASGEADLAVMPVSEILHAPGVDFAGALPDQIQFVQTFSAATAAGATDTAGARQLIDYLASPAAANAIRAAGLQPVAR